MARMAFIVCIVCVYLVSIYLFTWPFYFIWLFYFILFIYIILLHSLICCKIANSFTLFILFIFIFIVWQENWGCGSTLTKACTLKEGKENIFEREEGKLVIHCFRGILEKNDSQKPSDCSQDRPGTLLVTLGILTHIRFLHLVVSDVQFLLFGVDVKGHNLYCWDWLFICLPYFDFDSFICHWCLLKYMTSCLNLIILCFRLNPILHCSLYPAHGLIFEVGLFMFIDWHLLLFPNPNFTSFLFVLYSFSFTVFKSLSFVFGCTMGNDGSVDTRDEACNNLNMLAQILDSWFQGIVVNWRNWR